MTQTPGHIRQAAHEAALAVHLLDFDLQAAASANVEAAVARDHLARAFHKYRQIVRAMTALEQVAPNAAQAGYDADDRIQDFKQERAA